MITWRVGRCLIVQQSSVVAHRDSRTVRVPSCPTIETVLITTSKLVNDELTIHTCSYRALSFGKEKNLFADNRGWNRNLELITIFFTLVYKLFANVSWNFIKFINIPDETFYLKLY